MDLSLWQKSKQYLIQVCVGVSFFLFVYYGWGESFLQWLFDIPLINGLLKPNESIQFNLAIAIIVALTTVYINKQILRGLYKITSFQASFAISWIYATLSCQFNGVWIFYRANYWGLKIPYWDIIGILPFSILICSFIVFLIPIIKNWIRKKDDNSISVLSNNDIIGILKDNDSPITSEDEDWLGRRLFAKELSERILKQNVSVEASSIAIIAPWGYGKTSFLNLLKEKIAKSNDTRHYILEFSPWAYTSPVNVSKIFFETLASAIRPLDRKLSDIIGRYMRVLSDCNIPILSSASKLYYQDSSLQALYNLVKCGLQKSDKTFIIFIDDIDRLQATEILEVLKLLRSSANFPNLKFICAFDKHYVITELENKSKALSDRFIEKFFHIEYWLPTYDLEKIRTAILNTCRDFLLEDDYEIFDDFLKINNRQSFGKSRHPLMNGIANLRIANRWILSFRLSYSTLKGNILVDNLADIELLKLIAPAFFDTLRSNWLSFVEETNNGLKLWAREKVDTGNNNKDEDWIRNLFAEEKQNIYKISSFVTMPDELQNHVRDILSRLLPEYGGGKDKSFSNRNYTNRYFFNILQDYEIEESDFTNLVSKNFEDIKIELQSSQFSNKFRSLSILLSKYEPKDIDDLLKYIHIIFYAGSISKDFQINPIDVIYKFRPFKDDTDRIGAEFNEVIHENRSSEFTLKFFVNLDNGFSGSTYQAYVSDLTSQSVALEMLRFAVEDGKDFSEITEYFWCSGRYTHQGNIENYIPNGEAVSIYKKYWEDNFKTLYPKLISQQMPPQDDDTYVASKLVRILWTNKNEFLSLIDKYESDEKFEEAKLFLKEALSNDYLQAKFKFKHLKIKSYD